MLLFGLGFNINFFIQKKKKKTLIFLWSKLNVGVYIYIYTQSLATTLLDILLLDVNLDKFIIKLHFFSYIVNACKISRKSKINDYVINQIFKFQVFVI